MKVLIAGGGTGGHLFPGIAIADELTTRHPGNEVLFVGTDRGLEAKVVPAAGYRLETIRARGLKGMGPVHLLRSLLLLPRALFSSFGIIRQFRPDVVVGVGGYVSGPVVLAAWLSGIPTAVQEQNALPGLTNKLLGRFAKTVFVAFEEAKRHFPKGKVQLIGNPVRRVLLENYLRSSMAHEKFTVLVFGGSQGAKGLNSRILDALDSLGDLRNEFYFVHQTGQSDLERVRRGYAEKGFSAEVVEFIMDMSRAYARAELVICRAGATTLAELTVCKKAAILVPFPFAADNHQEVNARALVDAGAAVMFRESDLSGKKLAEQIRQLSADPARRVRMEKQAGLLGRPEAAKELADVCVQMMVEAYGRSGRTKTARKGNPAQ